MLLTFCLRRSGLSWILSQIIWVEGISGCKCSRPDQQTPPPSLSAAVLTLLGSKRQNKPEFACKLASGFPLLHILFPTAAPLWGNDKDKGILAYGTSIITFGGGFLRGCIKRGKLWLCLLAWLGPRRKPTQCQVCKTGEGRSQQTFLQGLL